MASTISEYERLRIDRIAENQARLSALGLLKQATLLQGQFKARKVTNSATPKKKSFKVPAEPRSSERLKGVTPKFCPTDSLPDDIPGRCYEDNRITLNTEVSPPEADRELFKTLMSRRCNSKGRGSLYDNVVGICCHFCRQKKLCGEENCERCQTRNTAKPCTGKTECSRCHSATGKFCRACLLIRYGQELDEVNAPGSEWLCPHCVAEERPEEHWICNSSICMTRNKMQPTGIAIFQAQALGFPSVAHWLQAQLKSRHQTKLQKVQEKEKETDTSNHITSTKSKESNEASNTTQPLGTPSDPQHTYPSAKAKKVMSLNSNKLPLDTAAKKTLKKSISRGSVDKLEDKSANIDTNGPVLRKRGRPSKDEKEKVLQEVNRDISVRQTRTSKRFKENGLYPVALRGSARKAVR